MNKNDYLRDTSDLLYPLSSPPPPHNNSFLTSVVDFSSSRDKQYNQTVDDYLTQHFRFVNKNRNRQLRQLSIMRQNLNRKFKEIQVSRRRSRQPTPSTTTTPINYSPEIKQTKSKNGRGGGMEQKQFEVLNPMLKSAGNTESFEREIESCNQILRGLRVREREVEQRKRGLQVESRMKRLEGEDRFPLLKFNKHNDYFSSPEGRRRNTEDSFESIERKEDKKYLLRSIDRANLRNYRNRNYYNREWSVDSSDVLLPSPSAHENPRRRHHHRQYSLHNNTSPLARRHPKFVDYCQQNEEIMDQLYDISQLKTELSEQDYSLLSSPTFSPKHGGGPVGYALSQKQKEERLKQLNSAKLKSLGFCQRLRQENQKYRR